MLHYFPSMNQHPSETFERQNQLHDIQTLKTVLLNFLYYPNNVKKENLVKSNCLGITSQLLHQIAASAFQ